MSKLFSSVSRSGLRVNVVVVHAVASAVRVVKCWVHLVCLGLARDREPGSVHLVEAVVSCLVVEVVEQE